MATDFHSTARKVMKPWMSVWWRQRERGGGRGREGERERETRKVLKPRMSVWWPWNSLDTRSMTC